VSITRRGFLGSLAALAAGVKLAFAVNPAHPELPPWEPEIRDEIRPGTVMRLDHFVHTRRSTPGELPYWMDVAPGPIDVSAWPELIEHCENRCTCSRGHWAKNGWTGSSPESMYRAWDDLVTRTLEKRGPELARHTLSQMPPFKKG
jgi:hypothetical protein